MRRPASETLAFNLLLAPFLLWGLHASDTDTFYHLASGRWMFEHGRVLDIEAFSFTNEGRSWVDCYWLFQCVLYASWRLGGYLGVIAVRGAVVFLTANLLLAYIRARALGGRAETLCFGLVAFALWLPRALNVRGQIFSYLFMVVLLWRLDRFARGTKRFDPALPLLCVLWANVHGVAYPIVLLVVVIHAGAALVPHLRRPARVVLREPTLARWPVLLVACFLAFAVNPFGFALHRTALLAGDTEALSQISEMSPPDPQSFLVLAPSLELWSAPPRNWMLLAGALLCGTWLRHSNLLALGAFGLASALVFYMSRFTAEFSILAVPFIAEGVARLRAEGGPRARRLGVALAALTGYLVLVILLKVLPAVRGGDAFARLDRELYPLGPVRFIQENGLSGNLFCNPTLAGYVTWELHPSRVRVFMDMRTPILFPARDLWLYKAVGDSVALQTLDRRYGLDFLLLDRSAALAAGVLADSGSPFAVTWADQRFVLFVHERLLAGRDDLRLRSYAAMTRLAGGELPAPGADLARVEAEGARLVRTWPDNHLAEASLVRALLAQGRAAAALARVQPLVFRYPREAVYRFCEGLSLAALGRSAEALAAFEDSRRRDPSFLDPYPARAELLAVSGRAAEALDVLEEYSRRKGFRLSAPEHLLLARLRHATSHLEAAADAYDRALWQLPSPDPRRAEAESGLAAVLIDRGDAAQALSLLDGLAARGPLPPGTAWYRARALRLRGRRDEARGAFLHLAADPALPQALRDAARREAER